MDREQFRKAGYAAVDRICEYFENIESYDVVPRVQPGEIAAMVDESAPEKGEPWDEIAKDFDRVIMPGFNWLCSPACTELESVVTDWVAKLLGFNESWLNAGKVAGGVIQGSASESCLTVCIAARERYLRIHSGTPASDLVIVATDQTHSLGAKAALILGLEFHAIKTKQEDDWALRSEQLREELEALAKKGKKPFILIATLGSTSTGAIDNIPEITSVTADYPDLFLHIDAAWGGVFLSLPECRQQAYLDAINTLAPRPDKVEDGAICAGGEVHSFCTNLHKSGLVTFDASCMWVRDRALLTQALDVTPPFLRTAQVDAGLVQDYRNYGLALGRRFRSLKIWFTLRSHGVEGFQRHLRRLNDLGEVFERLVLGAARGGEGEGLQGVDLFTPRRFCLIVIHARSTLEGDKAPQDVKAYENALNACLIRLANEDHSIMLTPTTVGGTNCIRTALGSPYVEERHVRQLVEKLRRLVEKAREETPVP
ncbi:hypothetical protein JCM10213v2_001470 [Rhodosporidiobolus nylandii]